MVEIFSMEFLNVELDGRSWIHTNSQPLTSGHQKSCDYCYKILRAMDKAEAPGHFFFAVFSATAISSAS